MYFFNFSGGYRILIIDLKLNWKGGFMSSSINSTAQDAIQLMMQQMYQKMNAADTDGTAGLSKTELSSIDTGNDQGGVAFLKSLTEQFNSLDSDGDGQLSAQEISNAKPLSEPLGPPPGMNIDSSDSTGSTGNFLETILEKLLAKLSGDNDSDSASNSDKVKSLTSSADTDKSGSLSLNELSSFDSSSVGQAGFVNDIKQNFEHYDSNGDGQLSQDEILAAMPNNSSASTASNSVSNLTSSFIDKLLSAYKNSGLSSTTTALLSEAV